MSFFSFDFWLFFALLLAAYFLAGRFCPARQWWLLLAGSLYYYAASDWRCTGFLLVSILVTWGGPLLMERGRGFWAEKRGRQLCLAFCLLVNIGLLAALKYQGLFEQLFRRGAGWSLLPLGISYYTFQSTGYCIDVYRGMAEPESNFFQYALYVAYFPQITQGPIGSYTELAPQLLAPHRFEYERFTAGLERVMLGFFKKLVVADNLAPLIAPVYADPALHSGAALLCATFLYGLQLYADFSGYMDIALGISEVFGIHLAENFETPYFSRSIPEFWRRWHISLGAWFRNYLYYPVLRSPAVLRLGKALRKKGKRKLSRQLTTSIGLLVTWAVIGLWHGAAGKFLVYGLYHGSFVILGVWLEDRYKAVRARLHIPEGSRLWAVFQGIRTFLLVNLGYVIFRAGSLSAALYIYKRMLTGFGGGSLWPWTAAEGFGRAYWVLMGLALLFLLLVELAELKTGTRFARWLNARPIWLKWPVLYGMAAFILLYLFDRPGDAINFIYFNF